MAPKPLLQPWKFIGNFVFLLLLLLILLALEGTESKAHFIVETLPGLPENLSFTLETGYIGIGDSEEVQLFYYFVESERNPKEDPLILWLTGGPCCSCLSAFIVQYLGPFSINYKKSSVAEEPVLELNKFSWTKVASIIFLDQPVGTGFSYATTSEDYEMSDTRSAEQTYDFLRKWLIDHPHFLDNPLYIGGDSYDGKILPIVVQEIYNVEPSYIEKVLQLQAYSDTVNSPFLLGIEAGSKPRMNMKGYILGNPFTDVNLDSNSRYSLAHRMALISDELHESLKRNCNGEYLDVDPNILCVNDLREADNCLGKICYEHILEPWCDKLNSKTNFLDNLSSKHLHLRSRCRYDNYMYLSNWVNNKEVQEALHIRKEPNSVNDWVRCNNMTYIAGAQKKMSYTYNVNSVVDYHRNLTNFHGRALVYSGDHDMVVSYVGTMKWIKSLGLPIETDWKPWSFADQTAGFIMKYSKECYDLTFATVKGAGHIASEYQPEKCFSMITRWFDDSLI